MAMGLSAVKIRSELISVHHDASPSKRTVFHWISDIRKGQISKEKRTSPGRLIVTSDLYHCSSKESKGNNNSKSTIIMPRYCHTPFYTKDIRFWDSKNLNLIKVYAFWAFWVPHNLSESNKTARVARCRVLFNTMGLQNMGSNYVNIEDESWFLWSQKYMYKGRL